MDATLHSGRVSIRWRAPVTIAAAVAAAGAVAGETMIWAASSLEPEAARIAAVVTLVAGGVLAARRWPQLAGSLSAVAVAVLAAAPGRNTSFLVTCAIVAAALTWRSGGRAGTNRMSLYVFAVAAAGGALASLAAGQSSQAPVSVIVVALLAVLPWLAGRSRAQQRALLSAATDRVNQLEHEREVVAEQTRLRERTRLAGEMHDSLGHELSLLAVRAGALELSPQLTPAAAAAVGQLRAGIGTATGKLAQIIGILHDGGGQPATQPLNRPVTELIDRAREAGMTVQLTTTGPPPPADVERTVYRIVQEALTNAAKHASGSPITVEIDTAGASTIVEVSNPLTPGQRDGRKASPGGRGLVGLAERVRLLGGHLTASPSGGLFRLTAQLPHDPAPEG